MERREIPGMPAPFVPWVTYGIVMANGFAYAVMLMVLATRGPAGVERVYMALGFRFGEGVPWYQTLLSALTMMWLHDVSPLHVAGNMLMLYLCAPAVEQSLGYGRFLTVYVVGNIGACLMHYGVASLAGFDATAPTVGSSGAVSVVLGIFAVRFYRTPLRLWGRHRVQFPTAILLGFFIGREVRSGLLNSFTSAGVDQVAHWAHVGGFLSGALISLFTGGLGQAKRSVVIERKIHSQAERHELLEELLDMVEQNPTDGEANFRLAFELDRACKYPEKAARHYDMAIRSLFGACDRRRVVEAYVAFWKAHSFDELPPSTHLAVAACYETMGQYDAAIMVCRQILTHYPHADAEVESALMKIGVTCLEHTGDHAMAKEALEALLARFPGSPWAAQAKALVGQLAGRSIAARSSSHRPFGSEEGLAGIRPPGLPGVIPPGSDEGPRDRPANTDCSG